MSKNEFTDLMERLRESIVHEVKYPSKPMAEFFLPKLSNYNVRVHNKEELDDEDEEEAGKVNEDSNNDDIENDGKKNKKKGKNKDK